MESRAYQATPTPVLDLLPSLLTTKTNRPRLKVDCINDRLRNPPAPIQLAGWVVLAKRYCIIDCNGNRANAISRSSPCLSR